MQTNLLLIYFIYGLAFYSMGLVMLLESRRSPLLADARVLRPLALFGFLHGAHEWLEMALLERQGLGLPTPAVVAWVRLILMVVSFTALLIFGLRTLRPGERRLSFKLVSPGLVMICLYLVLALAVRFPQDGNIPAWIQRADVLARYLLAIPGAGLAALALDRQSRQARASDRNTLGRWLRLAALGFAGYSLTQLVVTPQDFFLARLLNTNVFLSTTGIPVQAVRAVLAVLITASLMRASQIVDEERESQLLAAQKARLEALEQVQLDLAERAALRRELLRHTVIAQEDERKRIARELHDETAQFLTALRLNLSTLDQLVPQNTELTRLIERLQGLNREMSRGIYRMVHDLRPAQLDDLGLNAALQHLVDEELRRSGLEVKLEIHGLRQRLDPLVETVLFRIAQEAISNVVRHAGCKQALLLLRIELNQVSLKIVDEGAGFNPNQRQSPPRGWGLAGMRERAESAGGQLNLKSIPGQGTLVEVIIPLLLPERPEYEEGA